MRAHPRSWSACLYGAVSQCLAPVCPRSLQHGEEEETRARQQRRRACTRNANAFGRSAARTSPHFGPFGRTWSKQVSPPAHRRRSRLARHHGKTGRAYSACCRPSGPERDRLAPFSASAAHHSASSVASTSAAAPAVSDAGRMVRAATDAARVGHAARATRQNDRPSGLGTEAGERR